MSHMRTPDSIERVPQITGQVGGVSRRSPGRSAGSCPMRRSMCGLVGHTSPAGPSCASAREPGDGSQNGMVATIMLFWRPARTGQMLTQRQAGRECPEAQARGEPSDHITEPGHAVCARYSGMLTPLPGSTAKAGSTAIISG